jgi:ribonuclease D
VSPIIKLHKNDLPEGLSFKDAVAVDTETLGLRPHRDRLCLVQLSAGDGSAHLVKLDGKDWSAPASRRCSRTPRSSRSFTSPASTSACCANTSA